MRGHGGLIIGRGGENVKRMERESGGARMKMDRDKQVVVVTKTADQVARAVRLVEACVDRAVAGAKQKELSAMHAAGTHAHASGGVDGPARVGRDPRRAAGRSRARRSE